MKKLNKKSITYYYFKLVKQQGTPEYIARGVAVGLFIGFFVPFLFQMVCAFALAVLVKAAKIPALACTWVTNQFTIIFIYPVQCYIGSYLIGNPLTYQHIKTVFVDVFKHPGYNSLMELGSAVVLSFFAGGLLFGVVSAVIGYFVALKMVIRHRQRKEQKKLKKQRHYGIIHPDAKDDQTNDAVG
jgi:uncharacterized protein (DUF2062 family)